MFRFDFVFRLVNHDEEERYQEYAYRYGHNHTEEYTRTDGLAAGRARTAGDNQRHHT